MSTCEKVRFVKVSPSGHEKLTNLHSPESVSGDEAGVGVGVGTGETDPCDMTW